LLNHRKLTFIGVIFLVCWI